MAVNKMYPLEAGVRVAMYCKTNAVGVNFTAFGIGSGENLSPETAISLTKEEKRIPVTSVKKIDYGRYRIRGELSNTDLTEDILYRELGLYCDDPENGGEVLYAYGNAKGADFDYTETIRCFADYGITVSKIFEIDIIIDNYVDPTFTIDDSGKVDIATVNELVQDVAELGQEVETLSNDVAELGQEVETLKNSSDEGSATNSEAYTFVIDSNEKLAEWANNDRSKGQDYTSVLIKKGEWTSSVGVNLTNAGTKVVVGEAGSKLVFSEVEKGLFYDSLPIGSEYRMSGVNIACTSNGTSDGTSDGFYNCNNLTNCTAIIDGTRPCFGFRNCNNLTNCTGTGQSTRPCFGFHGCNNLTNCTGTGTSIGTSAGYGFQGCNNLTNCTGTGTSIDLSDGYGFSDCTCTYHCKAGGKCTTAVFYNSYASNAKTATYACADTPNGGFNDTTNPSA